MTETTLSPEPPQGNNPASDDMVLSLWRGLIPRYDMTKMSGIAACVAAKHKMTVDDLKLPRNIRAISWPRQEAMWMMRRAGKSLHQIGRYFDRDHTTCLHAERAHQARLDALETKQAA